MLVQHTRRRVKKTADAASFGYLTGREAMRGQNFFNLRPQRCGQTRDLEQRRGPE